MLVRPCFLIIDRDFPGSISTRKLVVETAKYNVITAYSGLEAIETLRLFPKIAGVVADKKLRDISCLDLIRELKTIVPGIPCIVISGSSTENCEGADVILDRYTPEKLLETLKNIAPYAAEVLARHETKLEDESGL
jgi:CheY-like chemotaxis protein